MLSNAYFLANFRFDTAENEPAKILQKISSRSLFKQTSVQAGICPYCVRVFLVVDDGVGVEDPVQLARTNSRDCSKVSLQNLFSGEVFDDPFSGYINPD